MEVLERACAPDLTPSVISTDSLANAVRILNGDAFDLIVLDLMLPYVAQGSPDIKKAGLELLRQLRAESGPNKSTAAIAISAFPDELSASRSKFDALGVLLVAFDDNGDWKKALIRTLEDVRTRLSPRTDLDFLVVCALEEERAGFLAGARCKNLESVVQGLGVHYVRFDDLPNRLGGIVRLARWKGIRSPQPMKQQRR